ncbi:Hypoxanthine-guanine phosphoribosyltransferase [Planctomycetes bacterium CA13]|uniref:Hypoxanthine phosphoribosyltransferase n=1 Tax=Novipirellula herctigrandis TaxID=2527986 RepID=A0A5C5YVU3_9BACT|nr:Hypoxanthine-guanine phosphoribosyltransferase [Planctomycetes bacterium CA13]
MRVLLDETQLTQGVHQLADEIDQYYGNSRPLTVIAVMTGSLVLFADLIRRLSMPQRVGVVQASSYRGGTTSGELHVDSQMMIDVTGRDVLLVDDIFDTGKTLDRLRGMMLECGASSIKTAVLLHKQRDHSVELRPDFVAFEIPDEFVVGYGLDYLDMYRNLPYLAILEPAEIEATASEHHL